MFIEFMLMLLLLKSIKFKQFNFKNTKLKVSDYFCFTEDLEFNLFSVDHN